MTSPPRAWKAKRDAIESALVRESNVGTRRCLQPDACDSACKCCQSAWHRESTQSARLAKLEEVAETARAVASTIEDARTWADAEFLPIFRETEGHLLAALSALDTPSDEVAPGLHPDVGTEKEKR